MGELSQYSDQITTLAMTHGPALLLAIVTLIGGLWAIRIFSKYLDKSLERAKVEMSLRRFFGSMAGFLLKILLLVSVASMIGIKTTSFVAIVGAAGLAIGLALQGSLANFAGGVLILIFKPFKVGDVIEAQGHTGKVAEIQIVNTVMLTGDNKRIIIPNGKLSNGTIVNLSAEETRRVDLMFGIGYDDDIENARAVLNGIIEHDERILRDPAWKIKVHSHGDSAVNLTVRLWCKTPDYWDIYFDMMEHVKTEFDQEGISIPYPQRDVHVIGSKLPEEASNGKRADEVDSTAP